MAHGENDNNNDRFYGTLHNCTEISLYASFKQHLCQNLQNNNC